MPAWLTVVIQFGNLFSIFYSFLVQRRLASKFMAIPIIAAFIIAPIVSVSISMFWHTRTVVKGTEYSLVLSILGAFSGLVGALLTLSLFPWASQYGATMVAAVSTGSGANGLLTAVLAVGQSPTSAAPHFSLSTYFFVLTGFLLLSLITFIIIYLFPFFDQFRTVSITSSIINDKHSLFSIPQKDDDDYLSPQLTDSFKKNYSSTLFKKSVNHQYEDEDMDSDGMWGEKKKGASSAKASKWSFGSSKDSRKDSKKYGTRQGKSAKRQSEEEEEVRLLTQDGSHQRYDDTSDPSYSDNTSSHEIGAPSFESSGENEHQHLLEDAENQSQYHSGGGNYHSSGSHHHSGNNYLSGESSGDHSGLYLASHSSAYNSQDYSDYHTDYNAIDIYYPSQQQSAPSQIPTTALLWIIRAPISYQFLINLLYYLLLGLIPYAFGHQPHANRFTFWTNIIGMATGALGRLLTFQWRYYFPRTFTILQVPFFLYIFVLCFFQNNPHYSLHIALSYIALISYALFSLLFGYADTINFQLPLVLLEGFEGEIQRASRWVAVANQVGSFFGAMIGFSLSMTVFK